MRRALLSVTDKTGVVDFAKSLSNSGFELISTGGTAKALREAGLKVFDVSDVTGFPEMMDGRIKTLHPKIHGALLGVRENAEHVAAMKQHAIEPIDMVVINLYPFQKTIEREGVTLAEAIEQIDIGGPAMLRSAAKNFEAVAVVTDSSSFEFLLYEMNQYQGALTLETRHELATIAFSTTNAYDSLIHHYLSQKEQEAYVPETPPKLFEDSEFLHLHKVSELRYGENPHQQAALYTVKVLGSEDAQTVQDPGLAGATVLSGKEMSYNNYVDANAAWELVADFTSPACAIIKHTNPAGVALGLTAEESYRRALACDPVSAFGGIVAFNQLVDDKAARAVIEIFTEVIIAPDYSPEAIETLKTKTNLRVLQASEPTQTGSLEYKQVSGGMLAQTRDTHQLTRKDLKIVTRRSPSEKEISDLLFAWTVCKHTKSHAIVYARDKQTVGVGAGQMSRIDSVKIAAMRAQLPVEGAVMASDAFFPFRDGIDEAAKHGIAAIIQPGGSVRDQEVIAAADEHNIAMVFTGIRHFKH